MLHDVFISLSPTEEVPTLYIDHSSTSTTSLQTYLKRHVLRSKVKIGKEIEEREVFTAWKLKEEVEVGDKEAEEWFESNLIGKDVRAPMMGYRWSSPLVSPSKLF